MMTREILKQPVADSLADRNWTVGLDLNNQGVGAKSDVTLIFKDDQKRTYEILLVKELKKGKEDIHIRGIYYLQVKIKEWSLLRWYDSEGQVQFSPLTWNDPDTSETGKFFILLRFYWKVREDGNEDLTWYHDQVPM